ncbi:MAG: zinc ABC transporter ATP-binding protein ZnuC [Rhodobacteraceae bacterium]|nr:MAG: zinc ABC transporter ATP-binding protein ZnuC [Paracoccaceae bacterium]
MALVTASGVEVRVGNKRLLHDVDLRIEAGEIVTVIGPNGAGKSTLLKAIIGAVPISAGRIDKRAGLRIGYTPQKIQLEKTMPITVARFLSLAGRLPKGARAEVLGKTDVAALRDVQLTDLSGGEFQRVLLARALLRKPDLLILDEPTQGLDQPAEARFYRLLAEVRKETGAAVLMVSHDLHVVMAQSDQVVCLNGHVCCSGAPAHVSADPSYKELFGARAELALYEHRHDHSHEGHSHD